MINLYMYIFHILHSYNLKCIVIYNINELGSRIFLWPIEGSLRNSLIENIKKNNIPIAYRNFFTDAYT